MTFLSVQHYLRAPDADGGRNEVGVLDGLILGGEAASNTGQNPMCNNYEQRASWADYMEAMRALDLGTRLGQSEHDLSQADDVRIGDQAPVILAVGNGVALTPMTFGFPPSSPRGGPVFNFRSEGRSFRDSQRCLVVASAFFEFTGTKYPKTVELH